MRCKQSSALFLLRVVAKIISVYVMKLENSLAILIHALQRIRLMLNFNLRRKPFMKCLQALSSLVPDQMVQRRNADHV